MNAELQSLIKELNTLYSSIEKSSEYFLLNKNIQSLEGNTVFDTLTSVPDLVLIEYPELFKIKKELFSYYKNKYKNFKINWKEYNLIPKVNEVCHDDLKEDEVIRVLESFESLTKTIPDKYKKDIDLNISILKENNLSNTSFESGKYELEISYNKNDLYKMRSEIIHEYGHLLEMTNSCLKKESHNFLKSRIKSFKKELLKDFYLKKEVDNYDLSDKIEIYSGNFIHPYVGRVYFDLSDENANTEVISLGLQMICLDHMNFLFRDPEHFNFIFNILEGNYE